MPNYWKIKVLETAAALNQTHWTIKQDIITIGRLSENDCCLQGDMKTSSVHARLKFNGEKIHIDDLNSTNGIFLVQANKFRQIESHSLAENPVQIKVGATVLNIRYHAEFSRNAKIRIQNWQNTLAGSKNVQRQKEALLVLDLCKSTETANIHGDNMAFYMKTRLEEITESVLRKHIPEHLKNTGDGFFATFASCDSALAASRLILQRLNYRNKKTEQLPLNVRMALHFGMTYIIDENTGDRHSNALNIAFKIEGLKGRDFVTPVKLPEINRIIATREFHSKLKENQNLFYELGPYIVRGVEQPIEILLFQEPIARTEH